MPDAPKYSRPAPGTRPMNKKILLKKRGIIKKEAAGSASIHKDRRLTRLTRGAASKKGAAQRVGSMGEGVAAAKALLAHPAQQHTMAEAALSFAGAHAGAGQRTVVAVQALLLS